MSALDGDSLDKPLLANLVKPTTDRVVNGLTVDMQRFSAAADKLGAGKYDVLSIQGYRNSKGDMVPDYDSIRIERRAAATQVNDDEGE